MNKPELRQFRDLGSADFERHPVWIACHVADYDEPWYDETDEETFRPWTGPLPVDPSADMYLVRATVAFRDGSEHPGFLTPTLPPADLGTMQPQVFVGERSFGFWGGMFGVPPEEREAFYRAAGRAPDQIFPLVFQAMPGLARGVCSGEAQGFYKQPRERIEVER